MLLQFISISCVESKALFDTTIFLKEDKKLKAFVIKKKKKTHYLKSPTSIVLILNRTTTTMPSALPYCCKNLFVAWFENVYV